MLSLIRPSLEPVWRLLAQLPAVNRLLVAYSGGLDSHVLLHLLASERDRLAPRTLAAVYIDHGLQADSAAWGEHCKTVCGQLGIAFSQHKIAAHPNPGDSPEAAARGARYALFKSLLQASDALLSAHHLDDQAETVLLQLLRGAGPRGLAAMPARARLGQGWLLRPLLAIPRAELVAYAQREGLRWIEDPSNTAQEFDRNYLRHEVLPRLSARWPAARRTLARSAALCAESAELNAVYADDDLERLRHDPDSLAIDRLGRLPAARQRNALRRWLEQRALPMPSQVQLQRVLDEVIRAQPDRNPVVCWPGGELRRYRNALYATAPLPEHDPSRRYPWPAPATPLIIPAVGTLHMVAGLGVGLRPEALMRLTVGFRRGGEMLRLPGQHQRRALKTLLQEAAVPPWQRDRIPLLYSNDALLAVAGLGVAADHAAAAHEPGYALTWQKPRQSVNV